MSRSFVISDLHLGHELLCKEEFSGPGLRPFPSADIMNEALIDNWNSVVKHNDKVYVLGDVAIKKKYIPLMARMNGTKRLVMGNHDIFDVKKDYLPYFKRVYAYKVWDNMIFTHIPIHRASLKDRWKLNVHGHLHKHRIDDDRYMNVSVEQINYTPLDIQEILDTLKEKGN